METLLLVEDDKLLRYIIKEYLEKSDFVILEAANGKRSVDIVAHHNIDLVLMDLQLPDGNGLDFIPDIRSHTDVPLLIISGQHDKTSKVDGLTRGADDYISKPIDYDELKARIKAHLRRYSAPPVTAGRFPIKGTQAAQIKFGEWIIDNTKFDIIDKNDTTIGLTLQEFQLLRLLIQNAGIAMRRHDICEALKEGSYIPSPRTIDIKVARIRKKINDNGNAPEILKTVRGIGYMFNPELLK